MDGIGTGTSLASRTANMHGTTWPSTDYAEGVPDATIPPHILALLILFYFSALAFLVISLRAA